MNPFRIIDHVWIDMSDGIRLSAKLWLPDTAERQAVPAILEFIPYRKGDAVALRDHRNHAYFAARGYACIRPDMRGHGDSEGIMLDEYQPREQQDALEVIDWISRQSWCDGSVGMMGLSWGGIASLQAAVHQPPALKAIIPVGASVDRYYDDGGYLVGCYPGQGLGWGGLMFGYCIRPPDPQAVGERWRTMWMERLEKTPMFVQKWLSHQLRDETWVQGSVCETYDKIKIPVLGVSGWNDCWPNTVLRLLEHISAPCRVVSGPWGHVYPNLGGPGPSVGFLQLATRWWDCWLKGQDNGVMAEPALIAFVQDSHPPDPNPSNRPGRWVGERCWPTGNVADETLWLAPQRLTHAPCSEPVRSNVRSPLSTGLFTGEYMPIAGCAELPHDQRVDDAKSTCFDTEVLTARLDILGTPRVHLRVSSDKPRGLVAARLCDVAPHGASTLISYGILNLVLREGRDRVARVKPGVPMDVTVRLNDTGYALAPGHRLRLAVSTHLWPMAWPPSEDAELAIRLDASKLDLPVRRGDTGSEITDPLGPPEAADPPAHTVLREPTGSRRISHDVASGETYYDVEADGGLVLFHDSDLQYGASGSQRYRIREGDPLSARAQYHADFTFKRASWDVRTKSELVVTSDRSDFCLLGKISAYEQGREICARDWNVKVPRTAY